jgi:hypothetical protein
MNRYPQEMLMIMLIKKRNYIACYTDIDHMSYLICLEYWVWAIFGDDRTRK